MTTSAHTPCRIDLAGGTLDIWPIPHALPNAAVTVNVALDLPARTRVVRLGSSSEEIHLASNDLRISETFATRGQLEEALASGTAKLPLLGRAVVSVDDAEGISVETEAGSPAGAGLGGSSALLCSLLGALYETFQIERRKLEIQALAQDVETSLLRTPTGYQDYFPPLFGGCLALEGALGGVKVEPLPIDLDALAKRMRLVYTGVPHVSGITNWGVVRAFFDGEKKTVDALHNLAKIARDVRDALRVGAIDFALHGVIADGKQRLQMAPGISTEGIEELDRLACRAGAMGTKVMGAGGGGCVLILLPEQLDAVRSVDRLLDEGPWQRIDVALSKTGLVVVNEQENSSKKRNPARDGGSRPLDATSDASSDFPTNGTSMTSPAPMQGHQTTPDPTSPSETRTKGRIHGLMPPTSPGSDGSSRRSLRGDSPS